MLNIWWPDIVSVIPGWPERPFFDITQMFRSFIQCFHYFIWAMTWQNMSSGVSDQAKHKPACTATEAS